MHIIHRTVINLKYNLPGISHLQGFWVTSQPQPAPHPVTFPATSLINWGSNRLEDTVTEDKTGKIKLQVNN